MMESVRVSVYPQSLLRQQAKQRENEMVLAVPLPPPASKAEGAGATVAPTAGLFFRSRTTICPSSPIIMFCIFSRISSEHKTFH